MNKRHFLLAILFLTACGEEAKQDKFMELSNSYFKSDIAQDLDKGNYAPPYNFNAVTVLHDFCMNEIWTNEIRQRITPSIQEDIYSLSGKGNNGLLGRWRDEIRSPALNQNFVGTAITIASPNYVAKSIYPRLNKELTNSAYYKKNAIWLKGIQKQTSLLHKNKKFKDMTPSEKKAMTDLLSIFACGSVDMIVGVHGGDSLTGDLLSNTVQTVNKKSLSEIGDMVKDFQ
ncbi:hypothetical protein [Psychromonas antarctica]|uniref:hypothetical protein n=1 Tax=Psychromonas antarctica TaxID=67573 RepID=UPI001EE988BE|nr:hypothetical protein [Psychromonas antarctica]MCG6202507.1 hypothetical protein [Psychromonas antarctica]